MIAATYASGPLKTEQDRCLKVLLIAGSCDRDDVGEAWYSYQWARGLSSRFDVTVLAICKPGRRGMVRAQLPAARVIEWEDWRLPKRWARFNSMAKPGYVGFYIWARNQIRRLLATETFDLVHQFAPFAMRYPSPGVGWGVPMVLGPVGGSLASPPAFRAELRHMAWFTKLRVLDRWRVKYDPFLRGTYRSADVVIGAMPYVKEFLAAMPVKRFEVYAETGILELPADSVRPPPAQNRLRLLFVGRVVRSKGVRDAIRAMSRLKDLPGVELDIVGDGEDRRECELEAVNLGVQDRVHFRGWLTRDEAATYYTRTHVLVFPSFREPTGNAVLEAMSHGLAVIVADYGGPAFFVSKSCGIRIPVVTPTQYAEDLAAAIRRLAENPALVTSMGQAARRRVAEHFLWKRKIEWMADLYEDVVRTGTSPHSTTLLRSHRVEPISNRCYEGRIS